MNVIHNSIISDDKKNTISVNTENELLEKMFSTSEHIQHLNTYVVYDETNTNVENFIGEYKIQKLMFIILIPAKVNILKNNFDISLFKVVLRQNKITFYDNRVNFFTRFFPKYIYEQLLVNNEEYKTKIKPHDYDNEIKTIMNQTIYNYDEAKEKFFSMNKSVESVIKDYLGSETDANKTNKSMNQIIYKEIGKFMTKTT